MLESIYVGVTGLVGFSKDLSVIGNNVANLNTAGFKASQLLFSDLFYRTRFSGDGADGVPGRLDFGNGVAADATRIVFSQGELKQTGNDQDAAISGNGFFVLRRDDRVVYTRAGQFSFDADGYLVSPAQDARVQALAGGGLRDINLLGLRTNDGKATTKVEFSGVLDSSGSSGVPYTVAEILLYGTGGATRTVSASFTHDTAVSAGRWLVDVKDASGTLLASGEIEFNADGTPAAGFNSFVVPAADGTTDAVEFFFGDPGSSSGARSISSAARLPAGGGASPARAPSARAVQCRARAASGRNTVPSAPDHDSASAGGAGAPASPASPTRRVASRTRTGASSVAAAMRSSDHSRIHCASAAFASPASFARSLSLSSLNARACISAPT